MLKILVPVGCLGVVGLLAAIKSKSAAGGAPVALHSGAELRVTCVSYGTRHGHALEPAWKRTARWILPDFLEARWNWFPPLPQTSLRPTLAVFLQVWEPGTARSVNKDFRDVETRLPGGEWVRGNVRRENSGEVRLEFQCYDRAASEISVRLSVGGQPAFLTVRNPRPIRAASWTARPLPQTNTVDGYQYVMQRHVDARVLMRVQREANSPALGWLSTRLTTIDPWGNWAIERSTWSRQGLPYLPTLPTRGAVCRVVAETDEYLSAGFLGELPMRGHKVMSLSPRLIALGLRLVLYTGGGQFSLTNGQFSAVIPAGWNQATNRSACLHELNADRGWALALAAPHPSLVCVTEGMEPENRIEARMRERIGADDGRIFRSVEVTNHSARIHGREWSVRLYEPRLTGAPEHLEIEIIHRLPPAEFFISPRIRD